MELYIMKAFDELDRSEKSTKTKGGREEDLIDELLCPL